MRFLLLLSVFISSSVIGYSAQAIYNSSELDMESVNSHDPVHKNRTGACYISGITIIRLPADQADALCRESPLQADDGTPLDPEDKRFRVLGCVNELTKRMIVGNNNPDVLYHEVSHLWDFYCPEEER